MSTIVKIQSGTGYTKKGAPIPVYKVSKYKSDHPEYAKELQAKEEFLAKKPILSIFKK